MDKVVTIVFGNVFIYSFFLCFRFYPPGKWGGGGGGGEGGGEGEGEGEGRGRGGEGLLMVSTFGFPTQCFNKQ